MAPTDKLLTLAQAAEHCACHPRTLRRAIDIGELVACRLGQGPKSDRIHPLDLAAWLDKCRAKTVCPSPSAPMVTIKLQSDTAEERIARLLDTGRSKARRSTNAGTSPR
ncbi:helix-turn-helix domain-containing protein [Stenotrophomonas sepilia]|uniref:helix-turn-helix domain-containing protein n=1 Tax=Stenotrophomonas sepilia TaxID=2860290 RepID=UPI003CE4BFA1